MSLHFGQKSIEIYVSEVMYVQKEYEEAEKKVTEDGSAEDLYCS